VIIDIIIVHVPRDEYGHERDFVSRITGIDLAALTPPQHTVRVIHQQVGPPDFDTAADVIMLSFSSGFAPQAYRLAMQFRGRGKTVIGGGPHVTFHPAAALHFFHAVVTGKAECVWGQLLSDIARGNLRSRYAGAVGTPRPAMDDGHGRWGRLSQPSVAAWEMTLRAGCDVRWGNSPVYWLTSARASQA
jgi:radical SAM superfamily enzyme YgiQ (UPF0313 family)